MDANIDEKGGVQQKEASTRITRRRVGGGLGHSIWVMNTRELYGHA